MVKLRLEKLLDKYGALAAFLVPFAAPPSEREKCKNGARKSDSKQAWDPPLTGCITLG